MSWKLLVLGTAMSGSFLPPVMQVAYVVADLHQAIAHWAGHLGAGPFYVVDRVRYPDVETDGVCSEPELALAFGYSGDLQIELVQLLDDERSVFSNYSPSVDNGYHHIGRLSDDILADEEHMKAAGYRMIGHQTGSDGRRVSFFDGGPSGGGIQELISADDTLHTFFAQLKEAAQNVERSSNYWTPTTA